VDVADDCYLHELRIVTSMRWSLRLPAVIVAAVAAAEAAVALLRPRGPRTVPMPVDPREYFSDAELDAARAFRSGQRALFAASTAVEGALLLALVARPPAPLAGGRPVARAAAAAAALSAGGTVATLPLSAWSRRRAMRVGLVTQSWPGWAGDLVKANAIGAGLSAAGGALLAAGMRRLGRRWWVPGAAGAVGFGALSMYAGPVLLDPLFNKFTPADPRLRADVVELARRGGVRVDRVLVVDASRRTTASNAYVTGLGGTRRVVLFDNLLRDFSPTEVRLVIAHELAHVRHADVPRALLLLALVAPAGTLATARLAEALGARPDGRAVPATALALGLLSPVLAAVSSRLSRRVEERADAFALRLTGDPDTHIAFHKGIAVRNVAEPDPPRAWHALFGTHPTTLERIGIAEALRAA
jgi:STE24 endopeptidase